MILQILLLLVFTSANAGEVADPREQYTPNALFDKDGNVLPENPNSPDVNWTKLNKEGNAKWKAVGSLSSNGKAKCTTTVFEIPQCKDPKRKAQVLTNGHCVSEKMSVTFDMFHNTPTNSRLSVPVTKSIYDSYDRMDIAILEIDKSYASLTKDHGIEPLKIGKTPLQQNKEYELTSVPLQGMEGPPSLYKSECQIQNPMTLIDTNNAWDNSIALSKCSAVGGSSGSSLVRNNEITGLINAGNRNEDFKGSNREPCQVDSCIYDGINPPSHDLKNFGFDVTFLHKCYQNCTLNPDLKDCPLPDKNSKITVAADGPYASKNWTNNLNSKFILDSQFKSYQVKVCSQGAGSCNCKDPSGYSAMSGSNGKAVLRPSDYLPNVNPSAVAGNPAKLHMFCIRGVKANGSLDALKNVTSYPVYHHQPVNKMPSLRKKN